MYFLTHIFFYNTPLLKKLTAAQNQLNYTTTTTYLPVKPNILTIASPRHNTIFIAWVVVSSFFSTLAIGLGGVYCSKELHAVMLNYVFRWPMELFDITPLGRIVNRFSKDMDTVDNILPLNLRVVITQAYAVIFFYFYFFTFHLRAYF